MRKNEKELDLELSTTLNFYGKMQKSCEEMWRHGHQFNWNMFATSIYKYVFAHALPFRSCFFYSSPETALWFQGNKYLLILTYGSATKSLIRIIKGESH